MVELGLGSVGNPNTLVWLFCKLHAHGKTLVRKGWRGGLPVNKPPIWVFCPLLREKFPRDRELIEMCEKCMHYKGVSHGMEKEVHLESTFRKLNRAHKMIFNREELEKAEAESKIEDEKWLDEERKLRDEKGR